MTSQLSSESLKDSIEECFGEIPDSRIPRKIAHKLIDIIAISILAIICGADGWSEIETMEKQSRIGYRLFWNSKMGFHRTIHLLESSAD